MRQRRKLEECYNTELSSMATAGRRVLHPSELSASEQRRVTDRCFWDAPDTHERWLQGTSRELLEAHVDKGIWIDQVRRWFSLFGRDRLFLFSLEEWDKDPMD